MKGLEHLKSGGAFSDVKLQADVAQLTDRLNQKLSAVYGEIIKFYLVTKEMKQTDPEFIYEITTKPNLIIQLLKIIYQSHELFKSSSLQSALLQLTFKLYHQLSQVCQGQSEHVPQ